MKMDWLIAYLCSKMSLWLCVYEQTPIILQKTVYVSVRHCGCNKVVVLYYVGSCDADSAAGWISPCCFWLRGQCCTVPCLLYTVVAFDHMNGQSWMDWAKKTTRDKPRPPFMENLRIQFCCCETSLVSGWVCTTLDSHWSLVFMLSLCSECQWAKHGQGESPLRLSEPVK